MFPRPPFPPPGPCGAGSPASPVIRRSSDSLPPIPTPFVSSGAGTTVHSLLSLPSFSRACADGPGLGSPGRPLPGSFTVETTGPRRFLRDPMVHAPCSTTSVGPPCQAIAALRCCRRTVRRQRLPHSEQFRGSITRPIHSLSTLRRSGHPDLRKTRFWLLARLCQAGLVTRRVPQKGFRSDLVWSSHAILLSQACLPHRTRVRMHEVLFGTTEMRTRVRKV
jgi:hypothetical protein